MTPPFYVNESLTPVRSSICYALRTLKKKYSQIGRVRTFKGVRPKGFPPPGGSGCRYCCCARICAREQSHFSFRTWPEHGKGWNNYCHGVGEFCKGPAEYYASGGRYYSQNSCVNLLKIILLWMFFSHKISLSRNSLLKSFFKILSLWIYTWFRVKFSPKRSILRPPI